MAPDLTWEGSSVQRRWLVSFMKNPNTLRPALIRRMPKFNVTDAEAETIADYIMTVYQTPDFDRDALDPAKFSAADVEHWASSCSTESMRANPATSSIRRTTRATSVPR
jgi:mono/diheme cytochrome c family protein